MSINVYLAGKISGNNWRYHIFPGLQQYSAHLRGATNESLPEKWPRPVIEDDFHFVGPYFIDCTHGCSCFRDESNHGLGANDYSRWAHGSLCDNGFGESAVAAQCLRWIDESDAVFAWLDDPSACGTMAELGYAFAKQVPIWVYRPLPGDCYRTPDTWLADHLAVSARHVEHADAGWQDFMADAATRLKAIRFRRMPYQEYLQTDHWKTMRRRALAAAEHRCQTCNDTKNLDVHHRTYERQGEELLSDLTTLCGSCHAIFHGNGRLANSLRPSERKR